jgi:hypothetical protein
MYHPCIAQWVVFNEGSIIDHFNTTNAVEWVRAQSREGGFRLIDADSGGPANALGDGDANDQHNYTGIPSPKPSATQFAMIGEYGGVGVFADGHSWVPGPTGCHAYSKLDTPQAYADLLVKWMGPSTIGGERGTVSAAVYTQLTDVENECDGMVNFDRTPKFTAAQAGTIRGASHALIGKPVCCTPACGGA